MGALNIQRYLIEYSEDPKIEAAVTISSPYNCGVSSYRIRNNILLRKAMHGVMIEMFREHLHHEEFIEHCKQKNIDINKVLNSKDNFEFDTYMSIRDLELSHPDEYYDMMCSHMHMEKVPVPLLTVNSEDDPLIPATNVPLNSIQQNPNIIQLMVAGGGHIEYFHGLNCEFVNFVHLVGVPSRLQIPAERKKDFHSMQGNPSIRWDS